MIELRDLKIRLKEPQKVMITTHHKPDGDALGSSLGLSLVLKALGHEVYVISPSDFPAFLAWLPEAETIIEYLNHKENCDLWIKDANLIFCLDFNHLKRVNAMENSIASSKALKIMIDHHLDPQGFEDLSFWDPEASSTCQLIYRFLAKLDLLSLINHKIATCLYTGIFTDSGSFRFPRTSPELHSIAAKLIEKGADNVDIGERINGSQSLNRLKFLGYCIQEKLVVLSELKTAYFYINKEELEVFHIETGETDGIINYLLTLNGILLAAFFVERQDKIKISFRSKGSFPVNELASKYFNGGGHLNASGGESYTNLEETVKKFQLVLQEYDQLLVT